MPTAQHWQAMRRHYLQQEFPEEVARMQAAGTLKPHLETVGREADEMYQDLQAQMMNDPSLPEDYLQRVEAAERIPETVREMVNHEFIHRPPSSS